MEPAGEQVIKESSAASPLMAAYGEAVDNESAYEILQKRAEEDAAAQDAADAAKAGADGKRGPEGTVGTAAPRKASRSAKDEDGFFEKPAVKSFLRSAGTVLGREITRSLFGTRRRR